MKEETNEGKKEKKYISHERCGCTRQDFLDSIKYIEREGREILLKQGYIEADCESCGTEYRLEGEEFQTIMKEVMESEDMCGPTGCSTCSIGCFS